MNTETITAISTLEPADNTVVGNPIIVQLETPTDVAEAYQYYTIIESNTPTYGSFLKFELTGNFNYVFTYYADSPLQPDGFYIAADTTISQNLDRLGQIIQDNPVLRVLFSIEKISDTELKITSRYTGTQYDLSNILTANGLTLTHNSYLNPDAIGAEGVAISDLFMFCDIVTANNTESDVITTPNSNLFIQAKSLLAPYNKSNRIQFDLSEVLNATLNQNNPTNRPLFVYPNLMSVVNSFSQNSLHWKAIVGVQYSRDGDFPVRTTFNTITGKKTFNAALQRGAINNFNPYLTTPVKFLSLKESQIVRRNERNILYFYVTDSYSSMQLRYFVQFSDGTTNGPTVGVYSTYTISDVSLQYTPEKNLYYIFHKVSEFIRETETETSKTAVRYGVVIYANDTTITEEKIFDIDNNFYEFERPIIYQNSLGGYDSFVFTGRANNNSRIEVKSYINSNLLDYRNGDKYDATLNVDYQPIFELTTGPMDFVQKDDVKEIIKSRNVYTFQEVENSTYAYEYSSDELLEESGTAGTGWTSGTAGTSGAAYKTVTIDATPTTSQKLYVYAPYFPSGAQPFSAVNNFILKLGPITTTLNNGATDAGRITVRFGTGTTSMVDTYKTVTSNMLEGTAYYYFSYNENNPATRIDFNLEAINTGDDEVVYSFAPYTGFELTPITEDFKFLKMVSADYQHRDGTDIYDLSITYSDTVSETNLG